MSRPAARPVARPLVHLGLIGGVVALPALLGAGCARDRARAPAASEPHAANRVFARASSTRLARQAAQPAGPAEQSAPFDRLGESEAAQDPGEAFGLNGLAATGHASSGGADGRPQAAAQNAPAAAARPRRGANARSVDELLAIPVGGAGARGGQPARSATTVAAATPPAAALPTPPAAAMPALAPTSSPTVQGQGGSTGGGGGPAADTTAQQLPALDANGRFATTYRPGAGHLAAFEAALASGTVPASARELVGDLGARYAPAMDPPAQGALAMRADLERTQLQPAGGALRLRIGLRSTTQAASARPPMSVHLVMDCSGSMWGAAMDNARAAARDLVERLRPGDTFSLTRFSTEGQVLVPAGLVGPRRAQILHAIEMLVADGGTNISSGLELGYRQAARGPHSPETVKLVMLLSDGRANYGVTDARALAGMAAQAFQSAVQTSSFGLGTDYDGPLMASIADQGGGGYYYVRDTARIAPALATELDARVQPVAQAVELRVRLRTDVQLTQTYGSRRLDAAEAAAVRAQEVAIDGQVAARDHIARDRQHDLDGGMRFFIPGFARDDRHVVLLGMRLPAGTGERSIATIELRYKDRITGRNVVQELPVRARYADSDAASLASLDASVARTVQGFDAGETLVRAARAVEQGDRARAAALLTEREEILRASATRLAETRFNEDAARLDRFRELAQGSTPLSDPLVLALLMDTSARGYMH